MNGDFSTGDLTGWTYTITGNTGNVDQLSVETTNSPTNSPHLVYRINTSNDIGILALSQKLPLALNNTWYRATMDYMTESIPTNGQDCYLFGSTNGMGVF
jgi:hypothetical protein